MHCQKLMRGRTGYFIVFIWFFSVFGVFGPSARAAETAPFGSYIYMAAANDLEPYAWVSLTQIAKTQPKELPVIAALHLKSRKGVYLLEVGRVSEAALHSGQNGAPDPEKILAEATVETWPDRDFSEVDTLKRFLTWAGERYPVSRRSFIYWGHGFSWRGFGQDDSSPHPNHLIKFSEFRRLLEDLQLKGMSFEWIAFDACSIGLFEVGYELRHLTPYVVFSSYEVPYYGYPYDRIFEGWAKRAKNKQELPTARAMVEKIVAEYGRSYAEDAPAIPKGSPLEAFKLVALETAKLDRFIPAFKSLATEIVAKKVGTLRWFQELPAKISSYDSVADLDALLYHLGVNVSEWSGQVQTVRREMGFSGVPDSLGRQVHLQSQNEAVAEVSIAVAPGRYTEKEARRALGAINRRVPLNFVNGVQVVRGESGTEADQLQFKVELLHEGYRGLFEFSFNPFVLGSRSVDITMEPSGQRIHLNRPADFDTRVYFPATSPIVAETHGAEFPDFKSMGILFTDQLPEGSFPNGVEAYLSLEFERETGWGSAMLDASHRAALRSQ